MSTRHIPKIHRYSTRIAFVLSAAVFLVLMAVRTGIGQESSQDQKPPVNRYGLSQSLAKTPQSLRIATYNMLNLADHNDDPALNGEHDDMQYALTKQRGEKLAEAIAEIDADVLALQEIESREALTWFRDTYLDGMGYDYIASKDVGYYRGFECAVLSRYPLSEVKTWPDSDLMDLPRPGVGWTPVPEDTSELGYARSPLKVMVDGPDGYKVILIVLHHKSGGSYKWHREAEAIRTNQLIAEMRKQDPAMNMIVLGDFNAAPWDKSYRLYLENGMIDSLSHRTMKIKYDPDAHEYKTHESNRVLDYVLLNSAAHRELVLGSPHVYGTLMPPDTYDWRTDPHPNGYAADHYPVVIELMPQEKP